MGKNEGFSFEDAQKAECTMENKLQQPRQLVTNMLPWGKNVV